MRLRKKIFSCLLAALLIMGILPFPQVFGQSVPPVTSLANGGFETWEGGLPANWLGVRSNISAANVRQYQTSTKSGASAVQLVNTSASTHVRFTTQPYAIQAGVEYIVTYWVRGQGQIRNAFYRNSAYSSYSTYTNVDSLEWQQISWSFTFNQDVSDVEIIFSVLATNAAKDHLQIDDVQVAANLPGVGPVTADPPPGPVAAGTGVTLATATPGATIHYTIDGSEPSAASPVYSAPIIINSATTIKAIALKEGMDSSPVGVFAYTVTSSVPSFLSMVNGDFELWDGDLPLNWRGERSDLALSNIKRYTASVKSGTSAVQLINTTTTHRRFTTQTYAIEANTEYLVTFWVRGQGDIRNGFYRNGGWATYTPYTSVDSLEWQQVTWKFFHTNDAEDFQMIFSLRSTNADKDHLQIDDVRVLKITPMVEARPLPLNTEVVVEGVISAILGNGQNIFFQDATAGLVARFANAAMSSGLNPGDRIRVRGTMGAYAQLVQVNVPLGNVTLVQAGTILPTAKTMTLDQLNSSHQGQVIKVENLTVKTVGTGTSYNVTVEDQAGRTIVLRVENTVERAFFTVGKQLTVTAPLGQFNNDLQLMVRGLSDLEDHGQAPGPGPSERTIAQLKQLPLGGQAIIEGIVTAVMGTREAYITDGTAAIQVNIPDIHTKVKVGDRVKVEGQLISFRGELQLEPASLAKIEVISSDNPLPEPVQVSLKQAGQTTNYTEVGAALATYKGDGKTTITVRGIITSFLPNGEFAMQIADRSDPTKVLSVALPAGYRETFSPFHNLDAIGKMVVVTGQEQNYFGQPAIRHVQGWDNTTGTTIPTPYHVGWNVEGQLITITKPFEVTQKDSYGFWVRDEEASVYIYTGRAVNFNLAEIKIGDWYTITGIAAFYDRAQIKLRNGSDLEFAVAPGQQDPREPMVLAPKPGPFTSTFERTPLISVKLEKSSLTEAEIDYNSLELYVNGVKITPVINQAANTVSYQVPENLAYGQHDVRIVVPDTEGRVKDYSWFFTVARETFNYNFYFGVPHSHTAYSDGTLTPTHAYEHARGNRLDFLIVTDHSNWFDGVREGNFEFDAARNEYGEALNPLTGDKSFWWKTRLEAEAINAKYNNFLALRGFEMTSSLWGHMNAINTHTYVEAKKQMVPLRDYYEWIVDVSTRPGANVFNVFNHPNWPADSFANLAYVPRLDRFINGIEVANGAPPYSYSRAEGHYWRALDNGWRLGAMNAQDNHAANWGDSDQLTVVIAESLETDTFIDAMNARRMYSTETRSLRLTVLANGHWMGSVLDVTAGDQLSFDILAEDSIVKIERLQLITNGGWVMEEKVFPGGTHVAEWEPVITAQGGAQWFVVKVIHTDGSWGHASPIYTVGGEYDLKLTGINLSPNPTLPGLETKLEATVTNMGIRHLEDDIEVKFYMNNPGDPASLIGTATFIGRLPSGSSVTVSTTWTPPNNDGQHRIYAVLTEISGVTTVTQVSGNITIVKPIGKKVLFDGAHSNADVPGTVVKIIDMLRLYGYEATINYQKPITAEILADVDVLIINTPPNAPSGFTAAEEEAIAAWVSAGGAIMVANKSNHSHNPELLNTLMGKIGTTIRFNNDNVYEPEDSDKYTGNMVWSVVTYGVPEAPSGINRNLQAIRMFSASSLVAALPGGGVGPLVNNPATNLEILLTGNATSYNYNPQGNSHVYNTKGSLNGELIPMIAIEKVGLGRLVAAGRHFYSDFEIGNDVSNTALTLQVIDWLAGYHRLSTIQEVRDTAREGDIVTVRGIVTAPTNHFFDVFYIQDGTSGVALYGTQAKNNLRVGTEVIVTGSITWFEGELEIKLEDYNFQVLYVGPGTEVPATELSTAETMLPAYTGKLLTTKGYITVINHTVGYFILNDGSGPARIHVDGYVGADMARFKQGDYVSVTGVGSVGSAGPRIRVRFYEDISLTQAPPLEPGDPGMKPHRWWSSTPAACWSCLWIRTTSR